MSATAEFLAAVMSVDPHVASLAADNPKIDLRKSHLLDLMCIDVDKTRLPLDDFTFSRQLVERDTIFLNGRNHRGSLVKISVILSKCCLENRRFNSARVAPLDHLAIAVLRIC